MKAEPSQWPDSPLSPGSFSPSPSSVEFPVRNRSLSHCEPASPWFAAPRQRSKSTGIWTLEAGGGDSLEDSRFDGQFQQFAGIGSTESNLSNENRSIISNQGTTSNHGTKSNQGITSNIESIESIESMQDRFEYKFGSIEKEPDSIEDSLESQFLLFDGLSLNAASMRSSRRASFAPPMLTALNSDTHSRRHSFNHETHALYRSNGANMYLGAVDERVFDPCVQQHPLFEYSVSAPYARAATEQVGQQHVHFAQKDNRTLNTANTENSAYSRTLQYSTSHLSSPYAMCSPEPQSQISLPKTPPFSQEKQRNFMYIVGFKGSRTETFSYTSLLTPGTFVIVEADRGKDLGCIQSTAPSHPQPEPKKITRIATTQESSHSTLAQTRTAESQAVLLITQKLTSKPYIHLNSKMSITGCEFQFDRKKLTFYYVAKARVDFRELVRDLFKVYKTR